MANIRDVAKRAGVSITTVSRVINNIDPVNPETRIAVEQAMADLDYVPNQLARGMRTKKTNTIGVVIPEFINSFTMSYSNILKSRQPWWDIQYSYALLENIQIKALIKSKN